MGNYKEYIIVLADRTDILEDKKLNINEYSPKKIKEELQNLETLGYPDLLGGGMRYLGDNSNAVFENVYRFRIPSVNLERDVKESYLRSIQEKFPNKIVRLFKLEEELSKDN